jgi:hypothetical protein
MDRRSGWTWVGKSLAAAALMASLSPLGCVEDATWIDEYTVVLDDPANALVALSVGAVEGNLREGEATVFAQTEGVVLDEVYGTGEHELSLVSDTPSQRGNILFVVWADDPDQGYIGEPDCTEDGTRLRPGLEQDEPIVLPSEQYPLSWCGALIDD